MSNVTAPALPAAVSQPSVERESGSASRSGQAQRGKDFDRELHRANRAARDRAPATPGRSQRPARPEAEERARADAPTRTHADRPPDGPTDAAADNGSGPAPAAGARPDASPADGTSAAAAVAASAAGSTPAAGVQVPSAGADAGATASIGGGTPDPTAVSGVPAALVPQAATAASVVGATAASATAPSATAPSAATPSAAAVGNRTSPARVVDGSVGSSGGQKSLPDKVSGRPGTTPAPTGPAGSPRPGGTAEVAAEVAAPVAASVPAPAPQATSGEPASTQAVTNAASTTQVASVAPAVSADAPGPSVAPSAAAPPAGPTPASLTAQLGSRAVAAAVAATAAGVHTINVQLRPAQLGTVQVVATMGESGISVHLHAASEATREVLRAALVDLRADLVAAGVTDVATLDVSDRAPDQQLAQGFQDARGGRDRSPERGRDVQPRVLPAETVAAQAVGPRSRGRRVDLRM